MKYTVYICTLCTWQTILHYGKLQKHIQNVLVVLRKTNKGYVGRSDHSFAKYEGMLTQASLIYLTKVE